MSKKYFQAKVSGFFDDGGKQYILCMARGNLFAVLDGVNGYGTLRPSGTNNAGLSYGGFAAIELVEQPSGYELKRLSGFGEMIFPPNLSKLGRMFVIFSPRIIIEKTAPEIIVGEDEVKRLVLLEKPHTIIGRNLADSIGFLEQECSLDMDSDMHDLQKAFDLLSDIDCESGAVNDLDSFAETRIVNCPDFSK